MMIFINDLDLKDAFDYGIVRYFRERSNNYVLVWLLSKVGLPYLVITTKTGQVGRYTRIDRQTDRGLTKLFDVPLCYAVDTKFMKYAEFCNNDSDSDRPENTNLPEDIEILLLIKFRWILYRGFREVENVSANQRPGWGGFFNWIEKHKLGLWDLASCRVSLNSVQRFQRSWKCLSQSEARVAILFLGSARKTKT